MPFEEPKFEILAESEKEGYKLLKDYVAKIYEKSGAKKELIKSFKSHNETVMGYAKELVKEEKISSKDLDILITATILHDVSKLGTEKGKEVPLVKHGWESAAMAEKKLRELGRKEEFIRTVKDAIERHIGPLPGFIAEQAKRWEEKTGEKIEFPRPKTLVEKILYDADALALIDVQGIEKILAIRKTNRVFIEEDKKTAKREGITREEAALRSALKSGRGREAAKSLFTDSAKEKARKLLEESEVQIRRKLEKERTEKQS